MREVRFSAGTPAGGPVANSWGGWPAATGLQPYVRLRVCIEGDPDPETGYICNIAQLDQLLRSRVIPIFNGKDAGGCPPERLLQTVARELAPHAPPAAGWAWWELWTTPFMRYRLAAGGSDMIELTQSFEFSAAHRLHCRSLSDEQNRAIFGKCNNPSGHGHNYQLEVTITAAASDPSGRVLPIAEFERIVRERVIDRFDHKHLNEDCPEFAATNPSVENITRVAWSLLEGRFAPARLARLRVWETPKTCAELSAEH